MKTLNVRAAIVIVASVALLCPSSGRIIGAPEQVSNLDRLQDCARILSDSLTGAFLPGDSLCCLTAAHPAAWLVDQVVVSTTTLRGIHSVACGREAVASIFPAIIDIGIEYRLTDDPDVVQRTSRLTLSAVMPAGRLSTLQITRTFTANIVDTVETDKTQLLSNSSYDFTKGVSVSVAKPGFWEKIVEPAVIVGSAAVMIILLFSVRSR